MDTSPSHGNSNERSTGEAAFQEIRAEAEQSEDVLGFVICGSRGKGSEDEHSDYDCALIVSEEKYEAYRKRYEDLPSEVELTIFTLQGFKNHASPGSSFEWDRYNWSHLRADPDRTGGELQRLIEEKSRIPGNNVQAFVSTSLDWHVNQVYRSMKCLRAGDQLAHHLEGAEGIRPFLQAAFCLQDRRVMPYYKYLKWELAHFPLRNLSLGSEELLNRVESILETGNHLAQQDLLRESERLGRTNGYGPVFDAWTGKDQWAMSFVPRSR